MTITKRQRKMPYCSSVTENFVCAKKFCFDPPFFNGSCPRALSAQYSAHHTSRKSQLARFTAHPFFHPGVRNKVRVRFRIWIRVRLGLGLGLRLRVTVRNSVRVRSRVRGKGWGNYGAIVSCSFCLVRCLLCHLIFLKTLIMASDLNLMTMLHVTLVTRLKRDGTHLLHGTL